MKNIFILSLFLLISCYLQAQQKKILFDATKAESAGNADWVIDADVHNLGFPSGPAVPGQGDESNPQRIPTPSQGNIVASTPETYWNGGISAWGVDLVKKGYTVETLPYNGSITYGNSSNAQDLSNYNVFVICEPNIVFSASEKSALIHFVQNGGGLMMVSDHTDSDRNNDGWDSPHVWDDFLSSNGIQADPFGMTFDYVTFSQTSSNIPNLPSDPLLHGPMGNVTQVMWSSGTSITLTPSSNPTVKGVVYKNGSGFGNTNSMVAYASYGSGRVVGFGDSSPCDDGSGDSNDNLYDGWIADANGNHEKLLMNATIWLAEGGSSVSAEDLPANQAVTAIFPNPNQGNFNLRLMNKSASTAITTVFDLMGKEIYTNEFNLNLGVNTLEVHIASMPKGIYLVRITTSEKVQTTNVIIN